MAKLFRGGEHKGNYLVTGGGLALPCRGKEFIRKPSIYFATFGADAELRAFFFFNSLFLIRFRARCPLETRGALPASGRPAWGLEGAPPTRCLFAVLGS